MAFVHGKDGSFTWNSVNLSADSNDSTLNHSVDLTETNTYGAVYKTRVSGLKDWLLSVSGLWNPAAGAVEATLGPAVGTSAATVFKMNSGATSATNPAYSGNSFLESYEVGVPIGDAVSFSANFVGNGTLTRSTS